MRPLGGFALMQAREEAARVREMRALVRRFVAYFVLIWLVMIISYSNHHSALYRTTAHAQNTYVKHWVGNSTFTEITRSVKSQLLSSVTEKRFQLLKFCFN